MATCKNSLLILVQNMFPFKAQWFASASESCQQEREWNSPQNYKWRTTLLFKTRFFIHMTTWFTHKVVRKKKCATSRKSNKVTITFLSNAWVRHRPPVTPGRISRYRSWMGDEDIITNKKAFFIIGKGGTLFNLQNVTLSNVWSQYVWLKSIQINVCKRCHQCRAHVTLTSNTFKCSFRVSSDNYHNSAVLMKNTIYFKLCLAMIWQQWLQPGLISGEWEESIIPS